MPLLRRREKPPADLTARLDRHERIVSWADTSAGTVVAASTLGLWWPFDDGPRRIDWHRVDKVVWQADVLSVTEADVEADELLVDRPAVHARITVPRDLPPTVRKRVEQNIVRTELVTVPNGAVRFVARRRAGVDGLTWLARLEPGTPDTEPTRAAIRARLERLRAPTQASAILDRTDLP